MSRVFVLGDHTVYREARYVAVSRRQEWELQLTQLCASAQRTDPRRIRLDWQRLTSIHHAQAAGFGLD